MRLKKTFDTLPQRIFYNIDFSAIQAQYGENWRKSNK